MKKSLTLFVFTLCFMFLAIVSFADSIPQTKQEKVHERMIKKLATLDGKWKGFLEYLDYGDNKSKTKLPTEVEAKFNKSGNDKYLSVKFIYDEGKGRTVTGEDAWTILDEGNIFFYDSINYVITQYVQNDDNNDIAVFVFEKEGKDNDKSCNIEQTFEIHNDSFSIIKKVKYTGEQHSFVRHEYSFQRIK